MKIKDIIINERVRKDLGDLTLLKQSIQKFGLLHPIIVDAKNHLISGERRLAVAKELEWEEIEVLVKDLSYKDALTLEIAENTIRKDFENSELLSGIRKHHQLHSKNIFLKICFFFQQLWRKMFSK